MKRITALVAAGIFSAVALGHDVPQNFRAHLTGDQEVPEKITNATGQAVFQLSADGAELSYRLIVANIDNVVASHIHLGPQGQNGPVVAFLFGNVAAGGGRFDGNLAEGVITAADLVGPLSGQEMSVLVQALSTGGTYVNVHTNDGVGMVNTGPGDFASGEVRGQIK